MPVCKPNSRLGKDRIESRERSGSRRKTRREALDVASGLPANRSPITAARAMRRPNFGYIRPGRKRRYLQSFTNEVTPQRIDPAQRQQ